MTEHVTPGGVVRSAGLLLWSVFCCQPRLKVFDLSIKSYILVIMWFVTRRRSPTPPFSPLNYVWLSTEGVGASTGEQQAGKGIGLGWCCNQRIGTGTGQWTTDSGNHTWLMPILLKEMTTQTVIPFLNYALSPCPLIYARPTDHRSFITSYCVNSPAVGRFLCLFVSFPV